ncbi:MAG: CinA family protein [Planctomycetaceae bacterium]|nr:CinA family protein [Planctomycetaceae bacterium]
MIVEQHKLDALANALFQVLERTGEGLVLAESCTAGLIAASLARVPGMSRRLAGSYVVYQIDSKVRWLAVPADIIQQYGVVSREVAASMAMQALIQTPHANIAMSITGHLGPDAPPELDGRAWLSIVRRGSEAVAVPLRLKSESGDDALRCRHHRQADAVHQALATLLGELQD